MKSIVKSKPKKISTDLWNVDCVGVLVFVYYNLTKKCFSVKSIETNRVISHTNEIVLRDCQFKVSEKGRQRVLREQCKNVHAGVRGIVCDKDVFYDSPYYMTYGVTYNPYEKGYFVVRLTQRIIQSCEVAILSTRNLERILVKGSGKV